MKFRIERYGIEVIPETDQDHAYIEDTLGLKKDGESVSLVRQNVHGLNSTAYLTTHPFPLKKTAPEESKKEEA